MENKEQAFTQLVREHKSTIYSVCYMFSKDSDEIDDLFQEILIRLWKGYNSFRAESDVRTWIYRVSLNCCLNADKKKNLAWTSTRLRIRMTGCYRPNACMPVSINWGWWTAQSSSCGSKA